MGRLWLTVRLPGSQPVPQLPRARASPAPATTAFCLNEGGNRLVFLGIDRTAPDLILSNVDSTLQHKGTTMVLETVSWREGSPSRAMAGRSLRSGKHAGGGRVFVVPSGQRQTRLALCVQHGDHRVEIKGGFVTYQSNI